MNRRSYLSLFGITALGGCSGGTEANPTSTSTTQDTTTTSTTTTTTTTTTTPPKKPQVDFVSLVSRASKYGDVGNYQIDAMGRGALAIIGFKYKTEVHDGSIDLFQQVKILDGEGQRIDLKKFTDEQLVQQSGYTMWENALSFETDSWDLGTHTAEVLIRDNIMNATSNVGTTTFEVDRPLGPNEAELTSVEGPDSVAVGDRYEFTLNLRNLASQDGSVVSPWSVRYESMSEWYTYDTEVAVTMGAGETNQWEGYIEGFKESGTVVLRLDAIDETWRVGVS